jgi:hypothetical protein
MVWPCRYLYRWNLLGEVVIMDNTITWDEWEVIYKPMQNPHSRDSFFWGKMFETYEPDIDEVHRVNPNRVWTLVDHNPNSVYLDLIPGYHLVDRLGYFISDVPWEDKDLVVTNDPS